MKLFLFGLLISFLISFNTFGQEKIRLIKIPQETVPVLILQQDCPLKIEKAEVFVAEKGLGIMISYQIKSLSSKKIKSLEISSYSASGGGSGWGLKFEDNNLLANGQILKSLNNVDYEVVTRSEKLKEIIPNELKIKTFWVVLVEEVVFSDGTRFDAKNLSYSLQNFLTESSN